MWPITSPAVLPNRRAARLDQDAHSASAANTPVARVLLFTIVTVHPVLPFGSSIVVDPPLTVPLQPPLMTVVPEGHAAVDVALSHELP